MSAISAMAAETREIPHAAARFLAREQDAVGRLAARLAARPPSLVATCARGSSDHAAAFFKYLMEIRTGIPVASIGPSVASVYAAPLRLAGAWLVSVSQSGRSPDIVALQAAARRSGAFTVAVANDAGSPLALGADAVLPLHAGPERSVAATKSCAVSMLALAALAAAAAEALGTPAGPCAAVRGLPDCLAAAVAADWSPLLPVLVPAASAYVVGRGPALPVAQEAALKLKETASLHAEAFSGAEVLHGPVQLLTAGFPVLALRPRDPAWAAMGETVARLRAAGGHVLACAPGEGDLPFAPSGDPLLDPLAMLASFYGVAEQVARARGHDPDRPAHLRKVTRTL